MTKARPIMVNYAILQIKFLKDVCLWQLLQKNEKKNMGYLYEMKKTDLESC